MDSGPTLICLLFLWTVRICWTQAGAPPNFRMRLEETEEIFRDLACESSTDPRIMRELQSCAKELANNQQLGFHMRLASIAKFGCISPMTGFGGTTVEMEPPVQIQSKQPGALKIRRKKIREEGTFSEPWKKFLLEAGMDPSIEEGDIEFEVFSSKEKLPESPEDKAQQFENRGASVQAEKKVSSSSIFDDILGARVASKGISDASSKVQNVQQIPSSSQRVQNNYAVAAAATDGVRQQIPNSTFRQRLQNYVAQAEAAKRQKQPGVAAVAVAQNNLGPRLAVVNAKQMASIPQKVQYVAVNRQNPIPQNVQYVAVNRQNPPIPTRVQNYFAQAEAVNRQNPPQRVPGQYVQVQPVAISRQNPPIPKMVQQYFAQAEAKRQNLGSPIAVVAGTQNLGSPIAVAGTHQNLGNRYVVANAKQPTVANAVAIGTGNPDEVVSSTSIQITGPDGKPIVSETSRGITNVKVPNAGVSLPALRNFPKNLGNRYVVANAKQPTVANAVAIGTGNPDEVVSATSIQITGPDGKPIVSETSRGITNVKAPNAGVSLPALPALPNFPKNFGFSLANLDLKKLQAQMSNTNANSDTVSNAVAIGTGNPDEVVSATSIQITGPDGKPLVSETSRGITNVKAHAGVPKPAIARAVSFGRPDAVSSATSIQITGPDGKPLVSEKFKSATNFKTSSSEKYKNSKQFSQAKSGLFESSPVSVMQKSISKSGTMNEAFRRTLVEAGMDPKNKEADIAFEVTSVKRKMLDDQNKGNGVTVLSGDFDEEPQESDDNMQNMDPNMQNMDHNMQNMDPNMQNMDPNMQRMDPNMQNMDPNMQNMDPNMQNMDPNMQNMDPNMQNMADMARLQNPSPIIRPEMPQLEPEFLPHRVTEDLREAFASYGPPHAYPHPDNANLQDAMYYQPGARGPLEGNGLYAHPFPANFQPQEGYLRGANPPPFGFRRKRQDFTIPNELDLQKMKEFISQEIRSLKMENFENCISTINT